MIIPSASEFMKKHINIFSTAQNIIDFGDQGIFDIKHTQECFNIKLSGTRNDMTAQLYSHFGSSRQIVDIKDECIKFDLNYSIRSSLEFHRIADITTNHGTSEHVFNQHTFFEAMHLVTKPGGYMFNVLNCQGWADGNGYGHGFFLYQPKFIQLLAKANHYDIVDIVYNPSSPSPVYKAYSPEEYHRLVLPQAWSTEPYPHFSSLLCLLKKTTDDDFIIPQEYVV